MHQLSLFEQSVLNATDVTKSTSGTYSYFANSVGLSDKDMSEKVMAGKAGLVKKWHRKIRFIQQTLKHKGLIKNGKFLGQWEVTEKG